MIAARSRKGKKCYLIVCKYFDAELNEEYCSDYYRSSISEVYEWFKEFDQECRMLENDVYKCRTCLNICVKEVFVSEKKFDVLFNF